MLKKNIENYVLKIIELGENFSSVKFDYEIPVEKRRSVIKLFFFILASICDYLRLIFRISYQNNKSSPINIIYISPNLCTKIEDEYEVNIIKPIGFTNNLYINHSKEKYISNINSIKVYNIGFLVHILNFITKKKHSKIKYFYFYKLINDSLLKRITNCNVITLCHYDMNGLSLAFSKYRKNYTYTEIQHGGMINFFPYIDAVDFKIIDVFYVRNSQTISYLKTHLASKFEADYHIIPYPNKVLKHKEGIHILYASSIETNGFHPVFIDFLKSNKLKDLNIIIRLHPREQVKMDLFDSQIKKYNVDYTFDLSTNWIEENSVLNLFVISPWSSVIEEAIDNGFKAIIIDKIGRERFKDYIDKEYCIYTNIISDDLLVNLLNNNPHQFL